MLTDRKLNISNPGVHPILSHRPLTLPSYTEVDHFLSFPFSPALVLLSLPLQLAVLRISWFRSAWCRLFLLIPCWPNIFLDMGERLDAIIIVNLAWEQQWKWWGDQHLCHSNPVTDWQSVSSNSCERSTLCYVVTFQGSDYFAEPWSKYDIQVCVRSLLTSSDDNSSTKRVCGHNTTWKTRHQSLSDWWSQSAIAQKL